MLADEINQVRQNAIGAAGIMEERQMTVDGITHTLPVPFMVLASPDPIEYEGTFPLPEAQLDRFIYASISATPPGKRNQDSGGTATGPSDHGTHACCVR